MMMQDALAEIGGVEMGGGRGGVEQLTKPELFTHFSSPTLLRAALPAVPILLFPPAILPNGFRRCQRYRPRDSRF